MQTQSTNDILAGHIYTSDETRLHPSFGELVGASNIDIYT